MRHGLYRLFAAAASAGVACLPTLAQPALPPPPHAIGAAEKHFQKLCENEQALFKSKIAFAEAKLDLQFRQRPSWDVFVVEAYGANGPIRALCQEAQPAPGDILAHLEFQQKGLGAALDAHRAYTAAFRKLIPALSPDQARILAESPIRPLPPFPPAGGPLGPRP